MSLGGGSKQADLRNKRSSFHFYKKHGDTQKALAEIEETLTNMTSVSKREAGRKLINLRSRTRANSKTLSEMKTYLPVGYSNSKMLISKDAPAQHQ
jgi:hypothetical protein